ncbi:MAG: 2-succinyl-5-enolpyruvyl-6-hydroxy-3-cyclohexene-1-carboxylic-acid synthase [Actinomycetota bacterium]|nr:2-succinyl-5-enolpyruvyl-6-hydroxy-3-cyclohexene-1-carboxylic-acid synthase [Actinomycetota bacterium]
MSPPNPSTALASVIIDELARNGVGLVVLSPGSRSAALAIAAVGHPGIETRVVIDERSAAFHALGRAKASGEPAALICTSGSAPAHYFPGVVEADMSSTPLVVISADRPVEMHGIGSNQTIDQTEFYGKKVRGFAHIEAPEPGEDLNDRWRSTVARLVQASKGVEGSPGPVQLNVAFREPTVPVGDDGRSTADRYPFGVEGRPGGGAWSVARSSPVPIEPLDMDGTNRAVVIAGDGYYDGPGLVREATRLGWPVLATVVSGLRGHDVVARYQHILAGGVPSHLQPSAAIVVGSIGPGDRLERLASGAARELRLDRWGRNLDPSHTADAVLHTDPVLSLEGVTGGAGTVWRESWLEADSAVTAVLDPGDHLSGAAVAEALNDIGWGWLVVGSSLAIRDADAHVRKAGRVVANRGASGIDGFVSTALGVASQGERVLAVTGDLSFLHDSNGFINDADDDLVVIVVDNDGGGLFDLLPQARHAPDFERLFIAPHGRDIGAVARLHHLGYVKVANAGELVEHANSALEAGGRTVIHVPVDRDTDLSVRASLDSSATELFF